jgi:hypothetical protein
MHLEHERLRRRIADAVGVLYSELRLAVVCWYYSVRGVGMATSTYPTPPRPTSAARAPGPAHLSRTYATISGRLTKSGSGANGTVEKGSRVRAGRTVC